MTASRDKATPQPDDFGLAEAAKEPISAMVRDCKSLFDKSFRVWKSNGEKRYEFALWKLENTFLDWVDDLGVFAEADRSLDQRLERHPRYRDSILALLDLLKMNLVHTADPSEPDSNDSSDEEVDIRRIELEHIYESLGELNRLAIHIRNSSASALDSRVRKFASRNPVEAYSFKFKARLAVNCLYPRASKGLRKYLSLLMGQTHMKFLYWQYLDENLRKGHRLDGQSKDGSKQIQQDPSAMLAKRLSPQPSVIDQKQALLDSEADRILVSTSVLSETLPSDLGSGFTIPATDTEMPSPRRAETSIFLGSKAKFPDPPKFNDGEAQKPCPLCRKNFSEAEFTDDIWWKCHVNEDLLPFVCISNLCIQPPSFARRSEWRAHMQGYHSIFWQRVPAVQMSNSTHSLHPDSQERLEVGPSEDICPLCYMSPVTPGGPTIDSNNVIESCKKNTMGVADSDEEPATRAEKPVVDHMASLMMNHIADHLQFLALLTVRLSAREVTEGDEHSFSSSAALSSNQDFAQRSTLDDEFEFVEGDVSKEKDEPEFLTDAPPDLEFPEDEWIESILKDVGQEADINISTCRPPSLSH